MKWNRKNVGIKNSAELLAEKSFLRLHLRMSLRVFFSILISSPFTVTLHTATKRDEEDFFRKHFFLISPCFVAPVDSEFFVLRFTVL